MSDTRFQLPINLGLPLQRFLGSGFTYSSYWAGITTCDFHDTGTRMQTRVTVLDDGQLLLALLTRADELNLEYEIQCYAKRVTCYIGDGIRKESANPCEAVILAVLELRP